MKQCILSFLTISLSLSALASDCATRQSNPTGKVYVLPSYQAQVNYFFDKDTLKAFATVSWKLDEARTRFCFNEARENFPDRNVVIPASQATELTVSVRGGISPSGLNFHRQANGHLFGDTDSIKVSYSQKKDIEASLARGETIVEITGDLSFNMTAEQQRVLKTLKCSEEDDQVGVVGLIKKLRTLEGELDNLRPRSKIDREQVFEEFLGSCVNFQNVEASSFQEFDRQQRTSSSFKTGSFDILGTVPVTTTEPMSAVASQSVNVMEIQE